MEYLYYLQRKPQKMTKENSKTRKNYTNVHPSKSIDGDTIKVDEKNFNFHKDEKIKLYFDLDKTNLLT